MNFAKFIAFSLVINLILLYMFMTFVMIPINEFSKAMARSICQSPNINCGPKK